MDHTKAEESMLGRLVVDLLRAVAVGVLANSGLCLLSPDVAQPVTWISNITFTVVAIHAMGRIFARFIPQSHRVSASTLGFAVAMALPLMWLSPGFW